MTSEVTARTCAVTGLRLLANNADDRWYRVAKRHYGPLTAPVRASAENPTGWGRYDTPGKTLYLAEQSSSAYAEVLSAFKRTIGGTDPLEADAAAVGLKRDEFLEIIATEWEEKSFMGVGAIPAIWRHDRSLFQVYAEGTGWWVDIEHPDSLSALEELAEAALVEHGVRSLTTAVLRGENRRVTTAIATAIRRLVLDDGNPSRGIQFGSKHGGGACLAVWLPDENDDWAADLIALSPEPILVTDDNLIRAADRFRIRVF